MLYKKKVSVNGTYAKKGTDVKNGDTITIMNEGTPVEGQWGIQNVFEIKTKSGVFLMSINQTSINSLIDEWGEDSSFWKEKDVVVTSVKQNVSGKFVDVYYVSPQGYELGENGFVKQDATNDTTEEIRPEDIPF